MIYAAYYDAVRRLLAEADETKRLTHVVLGSSDASPNAEVGSITTPYLTPITATVYDPSNPRTVTFQFLVPLDEAVGLVIREVGLLCADGTLTYRRTRKPIEKTADMEFGDRIIIQV